MTPRFLAFYPFILSHEAVYRNGVIAVEDVPGDNGGATYAGIDQASHPSIDVHALNPDSARAIYWEEWQRNQCELHDYPLGEAIFNAQVNAGVARAKKLKTATAIQNTIEHWTRDNEQLEAIIFIDFMEDFYKHLAMNVAHDAQFLKGWLNRLVDLRKFLSLPPRAEPV